MPTGRLARLPPLDRALGIRGFLMGKTVPVQDATRRGGVSARGWIVSVTTVALGMLAMVVDTRDPK